MYRILPLFPSPLRHRKGDLVYISNLCKILWPGITEDDWSKLSDDGKRGIWQSLNDVERKSMMERLQSRAHGKVSQSGGLGSMVGGAEEEMSLGIGNNLGRGEREGRNP